MQPRKILVVDDSKLIHKMFEVLLRQYSLVHAHDGLEALQCLGNHADIDLILLDINMPRMDGLELIAEIRKDEALKKLVVFVLTTSDNDKDKLTAYENHVAGYILKNRAGEDFLELTRLLGSYWHIVELPE